MTNVIAVAKQKGVVGKAMTCANLGIVLQWKVKGAFGGQRPTRFSDHQPRQSTARSTYTADI